MRVEGNITDGLMVESSSSASMRMDENIVDKWEVGSPRDKYRWSSDSEDDSVNEMLLLKETLADANSFERDISMILYVNCHFLELLKYENC